MDNKTIQHHGVKGMRWGHRRYQNKDGSLTPEGKKRYEKEISDMSDEELRKKINRAEMEDRYRKLTAPDNVDKGKKAMGGLGEFLKKSAGAVATMAVTKIAGRLLDNWVNNKFPANSNSNNQNQQKRKTHAQQQQQQRQNRQQRYQQYRSQSWTKKKVP